MIVAIMISMLSPLVNILTSGNKTDINMYQMNDTLYMLCYFIIYMAIIGILSCLYHMSIISVWFGIACNLTGCYIIAEAIYFVSKWLVNFFPDSKLLEVLVFLVSLIPAIFYMLIIVYVLKGAAIQYKEMGKKKEKVACKKLAVYWIAAFTIQVLLNIIIQIQPDNAQVPLLYGIFVGLVYLYTVIIMILLYMKIKQFCYDMYLYTYNGRL